MSNGDTWVNVRSEGTYHLGLAIDLAMVYYTGPDKKSPTVSHWHEKDGKLIFSWHASGGGNALPAPCGKEMLVPLIMAWLGQQDYGDEPDLDGSVEKGWRLKSHWELMPNDNGRFYYQFTVEPEYCEYHK